MEFVVLTHWMRCIQEATWAQRVHDAIAATERTVSGACDFQPKFDIIVIGLILGYCCSLARRNRAEIGQFCRHSLGASVIEPGDQGKAEGGDGSCASSDAKL